MLFSVTLRLLSSANNLSVIQDIIYIRGWSLGRAEELGKGGDEARLSGTGWSIGKDMHAFAAHNAFKSQVK